MIGSSVFKLLSRLYEPEAFMRYILLLSALCLAVPVILPSSLVSIYVAFVVFEFSVGIFWPAVSLENPKN